MTLARRVQAMARHNRPEPLEYELWVCVTHFHGQVTAL